MEDKIIYEVLRVIDRKSIFLESHLKRMKNSFNLINEEFLVSYEEISKEIEELIESENRSEGNIKITFGVNEKKLRVFLLNTHIHLMKCI
ncbi:branched-subunit amino acid aminotransferase/4-amino-4-deoxychorismate lyase [Clostridium beijerinckii]|nr:branched-subunit amino acid aminotransferase/4-amino-4-deoxychorismate lyase [Clostridium beijerinckii]